MKIALIGYGKMGKAIEAIAKKRGHEIALIIDRKNAGNITIEQLSAADVAIEFSQPKAVVDNIKMCFSAGVPVVSGTTGWNEFLQGIKDECIREKQTLFFASNFSIGVNIFFEINKKLASLMNSQDQYDEVMIHEIHHTEKLDSPSGTAISLADQIIQYLPRIKSWKNYSADESMPETDDSELPVFSSREPDVPGTHIVKYFSDDDEIEIVHKALSRHGFALGAITAAEWVHDKKGVYTMSDLLKF